MCLHIFRSSFQIQSIGIVSWARLQACREVLALNLGACSPIIVFVTTSSGNNIGVCLKCHSQWSRDFFYKWHLFDVGIFCVHSLRGLHPFIFFLSLIFFLSCWLLLLSMLLKCAVHHSKLSTTVTSSFMILNWFWITKFWARQRMEEVFKLRFTLHILGEPEI